MSEAQKDFIARAAHAIHFVQNHEPHPVMIASFRAGWMMAMKQLRESKPWLDFEAGFADARAEAESPSALNVFQSATLDELRSAAPRHSIP